MGKDVIIKDMAEIALPENLMDRYKSMADRAESPGRWLKLQKGGFADANDQIVATELHVTMLNSEDYYCKWEEGPVRLEKKTVSIDKFEDLDQAHDAGFNLGTDLTFNISQPEHLSGESWRLSLPEMSTQEYYRYVKACVARKLTPNHVITKMLIVIVPTKKGGPKPKVVFQPIGLASGEDDVIDVIDVTPEDEASGLPAEWNN
jgi:hypothetical protein